MKITPGLISLFIVLLHVCIHSGMAQGELIGKLIDDSQRPLEGATVQWKNKSTFAITDSLGKFKIVRKNDSILVINYVGFKSLESLISLTENNVEITLSENVELQQIEIKSKRADTYTPIASNINKEIISLRELRKAPCCNLSESFETSAVVDANYTNAALGTREIEMLGLRGIYSQIMIDSRATMYSFAAPFAFDYIPGPWLKGVQVSKGAGTVVNGAEGLSGQINVDLIDARDGPKLFLNAYANHSNRYEMNIVTAKRFTEKWSTATLFHASSDGHHQNKNDDGFLDAPRKKQLNLLQRFHYFDSKWEFQINAHGIMDNREGGQTNHPEPGHTEGLLKYDHENKRLEIFGNVGFIGFKDPGKALGFQWHTQKHVYDARYAQLANGDDFSNYANLIYEDKLHSKRHKINLGGSIRTNVTDEGFSDFIFNRTYIVPGVFGEYNYNADVKESKFGFTLGLRSDKYDEFGVKLTPRLSMRYNVDRDYGTIRASAGRAYRMPNMISDNIHFIGTGRFYQIESIGLDIANNYGLSYNQKVFIGGPAEWNISMDFYHTYFAKQNIQDIESTAGKIINSYFEDASRINFALIQNQFQLTPNVGFKLAYKYTDAKYKLNAASALISRLYLPKHRGLFTLDLNSNESTWIGNFTLQWVGGQRLLDISNYPTKESMGHANQSPSYMLANFHVAHSFGKWEIYTGSENITNYVQDYQIVSRFSVGSKYFDATRLYAPNMGMRWYAGIKFTIL